jgi:hypothetical protein
MRLVFLLSQLAQDPKIDLLQLPYVSGGWVRLKFQHQDFVAPQFDPVTVV